MSAAMCRRLFSNVSIDASLSVDHDAGRSRICTGPLTPHTRTAIHFAELLSSARFRVRPWTPPHADAAVAAAESVDVALQPPDVAIASGVAVAATTAAIPSSCANTSATQGRDAGEICHPKEQPGMFLVECDGATYSCTAR